MNASPVILRPIEKAATQLKQVCLKLPTRPLSLWDAEYGISCFVKQTADIHGTINYFVYASYVYFMVRQKLTQGSVVPVFMGKNSNLFDSETWWTADQMVEVKEPKLGWLRLRLWCNLHD